eukprot:TRINITY_DN2102_c0_g2_i1.p1 TRINITY_DN2102_c0_g2~~TRINITY_DN2102_c0_g2_i1.p1  ORF type:complete len:140 (+),score=41.03 TRINITY_DN2102_c0_g2_i1:33-422(+)
MAFQNRNQEIASDVTWEDQNNICNFSIMINKSLRLKEEISVLQKQLIAVKGAEDDLIIADDEDAIMVKYGECFMLVQSDLAEEAVANETTRLVEVIEAKQHKLSNLQLEMSGLRIKLKSKFKDAINLDL